MNGFQGDLMLQLDAARRHAMRLTRHREDAEDLLQDCMMRALEKRHLFQPGTNLRAWLFTMMSNLFINGKRSAASRANAVGDPGIEQTSLPNQEDHLRLRALEHALQELPREQREVVMLVAVEGLPYQQAASRLGIPIGTVRSRLSRARVALAHSLDGTAEDRVAATADATGPVLH